jgi:hypothetical protein
MANRPEQPVSSSEPALPAELGSALQALCEAPIQVPPAVDEAILRDARSGFSRRRRFRLAVRWAGATVAAAAAVVVVAFNLHRGRPGATNVATSQQTFVAGDVDQNGHVDILDAFVLARKVDARPAVVTPSDDVNADGVLDRRDVDAVAAMAVRLPGGAQ